MVMWSDAHSEEFIKHFATPASTIPFYCVGELVGEDDRVNTTTAFVPCDNFGDSCPPSPF